MNGDPTVELTAQWALWGADVHDRAYHVLAASAGELTERDFASIVARYGIGTADRLPQYTVFWVPDAELKPLLVGLAIQERASYAPRDDRSAYDASGHEITYSRLFCVGYADLARHRVTFAELLAAAEPQLLPRGKSDPVTLRIAVQRSRQPLRSPSPDSPDLAQVVATLLLTTRQVCVLGADDLHATERLAFVDRALSLLPYGLRATLSAATWASPTARDLKLRLFFASARRDDGSGTHHVRWGQRGWATGSPPDGEVVRQYLAWLGSAGPRAPELLAEQTAATRFSTGELPALVESLPKNLQASAILRDLTASIRKGDGTGAMTELKRLRPYKAGAVTSAEREQYRGEILRSGLLRNHRGLRPSDSKSFYWTLLQLGFELPLCYKDYCAIVDALGDPPHGKLRSALLDLEFASYVPRLLVCRVEPRFTDEILMADLYEKDVPPAEPLSEFQREITRLRSEHRPTVYDFAVRYLLTYASDPEGEVRMRGYFAEIVEEVFPDDFDEQIPRVQSALQLVHGDSLSSGQVRDLFAEPGVWLTSAFEVAVAEMASSSIDEELKAELADLARTRRGEQHQALDGQSGEHHGKLPWQLIRRLIGGKGVAE